jgi:hypothetical protein
VAHAQTGTGSISGWITVQATGDPVSTGWVCAMNTMTTSCDTPDPLGYYLIEGLEADSWVVWWNGDPAYPRMAYQHHLPYWGTPDLITLSPGEAAVGKNMALEPGGRLGGQIIDAATRAPIPESTVFIAIPGEGGPNYEACADSNGEFSLESVALGPEFLIGGRGRSDICPIPPEYSDEIWEEAENLGDADLVVLTGAHPYEDSILFTLALAIETPVGTQVEVAPLDDVSLIFASVEDAGGSWAEELAQNTYSPPPDFHLIDNCYNVGTSASFSGSVQVRFDYDDTGLTPAQEAEVRQFHSVGGVWADVTDPGNPDLDGNVVCGTVTSLSPFAIVIPGFDVYMPLILR